MEKRFLGNCFIHNLGFGFLEFFFSSSFLVLLGRVLIFIFLLAPHQLAWKLQTNPGSFTHWYTFDRISFVRHTASLQVLYKQSSGSCGYHLVINNWWKGMETKI